MQDFLTLHQEYSLNYKQSLSFFRIWNSFEYLQQPGLEFRTGVKRVFLINFKTAQAFHDIGLRFSAYNRKMSLMGFDTQLNERNYQYK